jgi:hypothetical protein
MTKYLTIHKVYLILSAKLFKKGLTKRIGKIFDTTDTDITAPEGTDFTIDEILGLLLEIEKLGYFIIPFCL